MPTRDGGGNSWNEFGSGDGDLDGDGFTCGDSTAWTNTFRGDGAVYGRPLSDIDLENTTGLE